MIIAFDLDGTLSDPITGISASLNHALRTLGYPEKDMAEMHECIGPPLGEVFRTVFHMDDNSLITSAITLFREQYSRTGFQENILYPGVQDLLDYLAGKGHTLYVATNKITAIARSVTDYFRISHYFKTVYGSGPGVTKQEILTGIRSAEPMDRFVMVGDRSYDMEAGKLSGYCCVGVLWGYGSRRELLAAGADHLCSSPEELGRLVTAI
ncbi:MAG: HAD hydrolase-like protein [Pseudomonadota bacterium]